MTARSKKPGRARDVAGSAAHVALMAITAPIWAVLSPLTLPLGYRMRYAFLASWGIMTIESLRWLCGLSYRIEGLENRPEEPCVLIVKHQSAWETLGLIRWFSPQTWVLKRSLLRIPFFGWGLRLLEPIAIDRRSTGSALQQVLSQGRDRLARGRWVVIFPEGTRMPPGKKGQYRQGGAELAISAGVPVLPVAHNAGHFWPRGSWLKRAGRIDVRVGPPIPTRERKAADVMREAEDWIESRMAELEGRR